MGNRIYGLYYMYNASNNIGAVGGEVALNGQKFEWYTLNDVVMGG